MNRFRTFLFALMFALSSAVFARASEPVLAVIDEPALTGSGKPLTAEGLKQIVTKVAQGKNWTVTPMRDGKLSALLSWRNNKHSILVEITCTADRYSILYRNSINMDYAVWDGQAIIHPYYNRYVNELRGAIRAEMLRQ